MGLKVQIIQNFINENGYGDPNCVWRIKSFTFEFAGLESFFSITYEVKPSAAIEGVALRQMTQRIPFDWANPEDTAFLYQISDKIHVKNQEVAFIPTMEGIKSFTDLNALTVDVGEIEIPE